MNKPEPKEITDEFFKTHRLPNKPTMDDLSRVFVIAAKMYFNKELDLPSFSTISSALLFDFFSQWDILSTSLGQALDAGSEMNFYNDNLNEHKDSLTEDSIKLIEHSKVMIYRFEEEIKYYIESLDKPQKTESHKYSR